MKHELIVLGNSLVDYTAFVDKAFLRQQGFEEGQQFPIDEEKRLAVERILDYQLFSGGAAANTAATYANLGGTAAFIGAVANDDNGKFFDKDLERSDVHTYVSTKDEGRTGVVMALVTGRERTLPFDLDDSPMLRKEELPYNTIMGSSMFHSTGFVIASMYDTLHSAMRTAHDNDVKVSFDIGAKFVVDNHREKIDALMEYVDILFANETEAKALTGEEPLEAVNILAQQVPIAVVKMGPDGSYLKSGNDLYFIPAFKTEAINTTGAGDSFAGAFLYSFAQGYNLEESARIGSYYASKVVANELTKLDYKVNIENALR